MLESTIPSGNGSSGLVKMHLSGPVGGKRRVKPERLISV
jgi:hypothetical protein